MAEPLREPAASRGNADEASAATSSRSSSAAVPPPAGADTPRGAMRRGGMFFGGAQVFGMAIGFVTNMLLVRIAGTADVASYLLLLQAVTSLALFMQLGLPSAVLRFVPLSRGEDGKRALRTLRRRLFALQVAAGLAVVPLLPLWPAVVRRLGAPELAAAGPLVLGIAALVALDALVDAYLRALRFYGSSALLAHVAPRVIVAASLAGLLLSNRVVSWQLLALIFGGARLATALGYVARLARTSGAERAPRRAASAPGIREVLATTSAMGLRSAISVLFVSCDLWILSWARPHSEVAVYGVMLSLAQLIGVLPGVTSMVVPQEFAVLHADGRRAELEWLARTAATVVAVLALICFLGLALVGRPLIAVAFGAEYVAGWVVLLVLAAGKFWDAASGSAGFMLQMTGHHRQVLAITAACTAINVGLAVALAPRFGALGVAAASSASLVTLNVWMVRTARRRVGVRTFVFGRLSQWRQVVDRMLGGRFSRAAS